MKEISENVVVDVATRKKPYAAPEMQLYEMVAQSPLLVNSVNYYMKAPTLEREDIDED